MLGRLLLRVPRRIGIALLLAGFVQMVVVLMALRPGVLSIDEVTYLAMDRSLAVRGDFVIDNGYEALPSVELESQEIRAVGGRLVAQYPYGFPLLAAPFYRAFGANGLVVLNTLAFFGTIFVVYRIAWDVFRRRSVALLAAALFAFGTFGFTYSIALWPHAMTTFLVTVALWAVLRARERPALWSVAGLVAGIAGTLRLDGAFVLGALVLAPALLLRVGSARGRLGRAAVVALGAAPALLFLAWTNHQKWGAWQPFSYGPWHASGSNTGLGRWAPLLVVAGMGFVGAHLVGPAVVGRSRAWLRPRWILAALVVVAAVVAVVDAKILRNAWTILVDMRAFDGANEAMMSRGPRGEVVYVGGLKQALLQSSPWLPLAVVGIASGGDRTRGARHVLALAALVYLGLFGVAGWHGGLCLEQRYLLSALPPLAILAAAGVRQVLARAVRARRRRNVLRRVRDLDAVVLGVVALAFVGMLLARTSATATGVMLHDVPMLVAGVLAAALVLEHPRAPEVALGAGLVALAVGAGGTFGVSVPTTLGRRAWNARVAERIAGDVRAGDLVVTEIPDFGAALVPRGALLADARRDGSAGTPALVARFCQARPCFAILTAEGAVRTAEALARATLPTHALVVFARENGVVYGRFTPVAAAPSSEPRRPADDASD